jgi:hypothetical protein
VARAPPRQPNVITTVGTLTYIVGGVIYASGHIRTAGWWLGLTAVFDVLDGKVARATGRTTIFGAFYDSTLDRVADGAVLGGLAVFFARDSTLGLIPPGRRRRWWWSRSSASSAPSSRRTRAPAPRRSASTPRSA